MTKKLTQEDITNRVWDMLRPQQNGTPLLNLLRVFASNQTQAPFQPRNTVQAPAEPTLQNITAGAAVTENPKQPDYPFIKRR